MAIMAIFSRSLIVIAFLDAWGSSACSNRHECASEDATSLLQSVHQVKKFENWNLPPNILTPFSWESLSIREWFDRLLALEQVFIEAVFDSPIRPDDAFTGRDCEPRMRVDIGRPDVSSALQHTTSVQRLEWVLDVLQNMACPSWLPLDRCNVVAATKEASSFVSDALYRQRQGATGQQMNCLYIRLTGCDANLHRMLSQAADDYRRQTDAFHDRVDGLEQAVTDLTEVVADLTLRMEASCGRGIETCHAIALSLGLTPGMAPPGMAPYPFASADYGVKGCYAFSEGPYGGHAFYGTLDGARVPDDYALPALSYPAYRPSGSTGCGAPPGKIS